MSKKIYVLSGVSGVRKMEYQQQNPDLKDLPTLNMANYYQYGDWGIALNLMLEALEDLLETHDEVVVVGYFMPRSTSRLWLAVTASRHDAMCYYRNLWAPIEKCIEQVELEEARLLEAADTEGERVKIMQTANKQIEMIRELWLPKTKHSIIVKDDENDKE